MTRPPVLANRMVLTRVQAARMLRAANNAMKEQAENAGEVVGWALSALRDNRHAARLKVDLLLRINQFDSADALLARCLLREHDHPLIRLRYARSLFAQRRTTQAFEEIARVLAVRPRHVTSLELGARIAITLREFDQAVTWLVTAHDERPLDNGLRTTLIEALIAAGLPEQARKMIDRWHDAPALASAAVLVAECRLVDAVELLHTALDSTVPTAQRQAIVCRLIDLLDRTGNVPQLRRLIASTQDMSVQITLRAAEAKMMMGDSRGAMLDLRQVLESTATRRNALPGFVAAYALNGRGDLAVDALTRLHTAPNLRHQPDDSIRDAEQREQAAWWLRSTLCRLISDQVDGRAAGTDPSVSLLKPLLRQAIEVLDSHPPTGLQPLNRGQADLSQIRDQCVQALGYDPASHLGVN